MNRSILVIYRPAAGRYTAQLRSVVEAATDLGVQPVVLLPTGWEEAPEVAGLPRYHADLDDTAAVRAVIDTICAEHGIERIFPSSRATSCPPAAAAGTTPSPASFRTRRSTSATRT